MLKALRHGGHMGLARRVGTGAIIVAVMLTAGCLAPLSAPYEMPTDRSLASDLSGDHMPVLSRSQAPEQPPMPPKLLPPATQPPAMQPTLPPLPPSDGKPPANPKLPTLPPLNPQPQKPPTLPPLNLPQVPSEITKTSLTPLAPLRVAIRAHVNGKPIFDDEVMQYVGPALAKSNSVTQAQR